MTPYFSVIQGGIYMLHALLPDRNGGPSLFWTSSGAVKPKSSLLGMGSILLIFFARTRPARVALTWYLFPAWPQDLVEHDSGSWYEVPATGARLTMGNAQLLLNNYVSKLPADR